MEGNKVKFIFGVLLGFFLALALIMSLCFVGYNFLMEKINQATEQTIIRDVTPEMNKVAEGAEEEESSVVIVDLGERFPDFIEKAGGITPGIKTVEPFVLSDLCGTFVLKMDRWKVESVSDSVLSVSDRDGLKTAKIVIGPETILEKRGGEGQIELDAIKAGDIVDIYVRWQKMYEGMKPYSIVRKWLFIPNSSSGSSTEWLFFAGGVVTEINGRYLMMREHPWDRERLRVRALVKEGARINVGELSDIVEGSKVRVSGSFKDGVLVLDEVEVYD